ncbi:MAG: hypothetical protein COB59_00280 [Rhodospirillaceae bacterium]|nr:MAG: hypothetical protein COB59_00280 [Rhodospirillaceae bacterium]
MADLATEIFTLARSDRARYLCALAAPRDKRDGVLALLAFDQEIARIPAVVSEPMLGQIRLQWWIDAMPGITGGRPPGHPVAQALSGLNFSTEDLRGLVEARNFDLKQEPFTFEELCRYANDTGGAFQVLVLKHFGIEDDQAIQAAREIGTAKTLAGFLDVADMNDQVLPYIQDCLKSARTRIMPKAAQKASRSALVLARLVDRELRLGAEANELVGAVFSVWWGKKTGRF